MKQQLTEALAMLEGRDYLTPQDLVEREFRSWLEVTAAARWRERLLPGECETCRGTGGLWSGGEEIPQYSTCPACHGSGQVWDEGMLEQIMEAASFRSRDIVIAVLSALVELLTEKVEK